MNTILKARNAITRAALKNPLISSAQLEEELSRGAIGGWLSLPAVRACTLSEWSAAMTEAIASLRAVGR